MQFAGRPAAAHLTKMDSAVSTDPCSVEDTHRQVACGTSEAADGSLPSGNECKVGYPNNDRADDGNSPTSGGSQRATGSNAAISARSEALLSNLNSVYFCEANDSAVKPSRLGSVSAAEHDTAVIDKGFACVLWELEQLPSNGELLINVVDRLEHLKACSDEANRSLSSRVAERREELTKAASVLGELRKALEKLRQESASLRADLSQFRHERVLPSLAITKQQQTKLMLQREMQQLLEIQRMEALLMAAENSCVNRQLPLQAALLVEGAALSFDRNDWHFPSEQPLRAEEEPPNLSRQSGIKRMQRMLENLKSDLNAVLQAAARSLPPPPCRCGWRQPEPLLRDASQKELRRHASYSGAPSTATAGTGEGTWPLYYSALAAFALLPPSSPVGSAIGEAVASAASAATRQVLCAFVPADAAAFSEAESDGLEVQRLCARLESVDAHHAACGVAGSADTVTGLPSAEGLAASVYAADAAACFMTLLGVYYDILVGASALMRWHASEALRLLAEIKAESVVTCSQDGCPRPLPGSEADVLGLLGSCDSRSGNRKSGSNATAASNEVFLGTYELAAAATQRLRGLPSGLRMALFLLEVRKQFLSQRGSLWQQLQQQTADVLQQLNLGSAGPTAVSDCLSLMHAVRLFVTIGESFVAAEDPAAENRIAEQSTTTAAAVLAAADNAASAGSALPRFGALADGAAAAEVTVAADAAAAAAAATGAPSGDAEGSSQSLSASQSPGRLSQMLLVRVQEAINSLHEVHVQELLEQVRNETWQRLPVLRRFPLVLLRTPSSPTGAIPQLPDGSDPFAVAPAESSNGSDAQGRCSAVCTCCGEAIVSSVVPNPFARWKPGEHFAGSEVNGPPQNSREAAAVELAAIEEELRAAEACGRRGGEPPVAVAASQVAAKAIMQYWQLAGFSLEVAAAAVKAMIRLAGFYVSAAAASALPEEFCSSLAAPPVQAFPRFGEISSRSKATNNVDAAMLRCRLPHLHWLLCQAAQDLRPLHKKLLKSNSNEMNSSTISGTVPQRPLISEVIRPMARLASPGALWGLAERVAAVESARDLLEGLAQQLHLQGLPQNFGDREDLGEHQRLHQQPPIHRRDARGFLGNLPREEQQQLWRLLAATRCAAEDLRALVYRVAAGSLCQSSTFLAAFKQGASGSGADKTANSPAGPAPSGKDWGRGVTAPQCAADVVSSPYLPVVQQQRRQVADLFWKIRCAGSGSISGDVQLLIWRSVRSQTVADAIEAVSSAPLTADLVERCLHPGPLVAIAEVLRGIIVEAELQYRKAQAAAGAASDDWTGRSFSNDKYPDPKAVDVSRGRQALMSESPAYSPLDLCEADFDAFVDVCSRTAPEVMQWCHKQRKSAFGAQGEAGCKILPLRIMSQMLQRLENSGLLQKGQTAEFESKQSQTLMQLIPPFPPP